jgi:hypothetical protein
LGENSPNLVTLISISARITGGQIRRRLGLERACPDGDTLSINFAKLRFVPKMWNKFFSSKNGKNDSQKL